MPAKGPVKIIWQIIFTFIPILDLWAFYRIKKLRKYFLYVIIPGSAITFSILGIGLASMDWTQFDDPSFDPFMEDDPSILAMNIVMPIVEIGFHILAIYLIYKWSKEWNQQFSTAPDF